MVVIFSVTASSTDLSPSFAPRSASMSAQPVATPAIARTSLLEVGVAGDEVGLGVDLDDHADAVLHRDADEALGRGAARLLRRLGEALGAQPVDRGFHVAVGLGQRLLGVHHAGAGRRRAAPSPSSR